MLLLSLDFVFFTDEVASSGEENVKKKLYSSLLYISGLGYTRYLYISIFALNETSILPFLPSTSASSSIDLILYYYPLVRVY